jgi:hypothetical protein
VLPFSRCHGLWPSSCLPSLHLWRLFHCAASSLSSSLAPLPLCCRLTSPLVVSSEGRKKKKTMQWTPSPYKRNSVFSHSLSLLNHSQNIITFQLVRFWPNNKNYQFFQFTWVKAFNKSVSRPQLPSVVHIPVYPRQWMRRSNSKWMKRKIAKVWTIDRLNKTVAACVCLRRVSLQSQLHSFQLCLFVLALWSYGHLLYSFIICI